MRRSEALAERFLYRGAAAGRFSRREPAPTSSRRTAAVPIRHGKRQPHRADSSIFRARRLARLRPETQILPERCDRWSANRAGGNSGPTWTAGIGSPSGSRPSRIALPTRASTPQTPASPYTFASPSGASDSCALQVSDGALHHLQARRNERNHRGRFGNRNDAEWHLWQPIRLEDRLSSAISRRAHHLGWQSFTALQRPSRGRLRARLPLRSSGSLSSSASHYWAAITNRAIPATRTNRVRRSLGRSRCHNSRSAV